MRSVHSRYSPKCKDTPSKKENLPALCRRLPGAPGTAGCCGFPVAEGACCCQRQKAGKSWGFPAFPGGKVPSVAPFLLPRFKLKYEICIQSPQGLAL